MPTLAATPVPTITAVGVARPREQGHAMTRTDIANFNANINGGEPCIQGGGMECVRANDNHTTSVTIDTTTTNGTNAFDNLSAFDAMAGFVL
mmetsp:Transcript_30311/g.49415  ORF Transcript_30311/g.49415 Transcript_30311/m.49415 type:complete len:92 (-) Transcript_30311:232-507(-)